MIIQFKKNQSPYKIGDIAGVEDSYAQHLISEGIAEQYAKEKPVEAPEAESKVVEAPAKDKAVRKPRAKKSTK